MTNGARRAPHLADALAVQQWADRVEARTDFPRLVRRLIRQTNDQVVSLEMRAAEGAGFRGYDGRVDASRATPFVPGGSSVWELGVGEDPGAKAEEDYKKRTNDSLGIDKSKTTFVFVTARRWAGKTAWGEGKRAEGDWANVEAFDADDLEIAFEAAPAAQYWFSELIGLPVDGIRTIENWWDAFSSRTQPNLTPELVLAGRADQAATLLQILEEDTRITTVSATSTDDVLAFVAATLLSSPEPGRSDLLARTLIVHDAPSLRHLDGTTNLLVLLPFEDELRRQAQLVQSHHVILLAPETVPADIALPHIDRDVFAAGLVESGVEKEKAQKLAIAAHRSLVAFQSESPARGARLRDWSSLFGSRVVRRAWLVGGWHEARSGDLDALAALFGKPYDDARSELEPLAAGEDPLFTTVGGSWGLTSTEQAWKFGIAQLNGPDLSALETVVQTVLGAVDPALELPVDQRWMASVYGKTRIHSADLRKGLATTLAACGAFGQATQVGSMGTAADWAASVVAKLLRRANEDRSGDLWASLSDVMPLLAEAAPDVFLQAVQEGVTARSEPVLTTMFLDQGDAFSVSSPHTGLLWALESLAWSPEYAALAANLLARLAEIDPGGRLSNRPAKSLVDIFRPWMPQTSLALERRIAVLDALRRDHGEVAWGLMLDLLPEHHAVGHYTHSPLFRTWKPEEEGKGVSYPEFWEFSSAVAERLLEDAAKAPTRWLDIIERFPRFPPPDRAAALDRLRGIISSNEIDAELRERLWNEIDKMVRQHRSFATADWALPQEELDRIADLAELIVPKDLVAKHAWLFERPLPDLGEERADYHEQEAKAEAARAEAVAEVAAAEGSAGLLRLASAVKYPGLVGIAAAREASDELDEQTRSLLDDEDPNLVSFASGYSFECAKAEGLSWIKEAVLNLDGRPVAQARLLQVGDDLPAVWRLAHGLGPDVERAYWKEFATFGRGNFTLVNEAAQALSKFGRPIAALDLLALYARKEDKRVSADLIVEGLQQLSRLAEDHAEHQRLSDYDLELLLDYLRESDIDEERLGALEWQLLPALRFDARSPVLERRLARDPKFFVEIVSLIYKPRGSEEPPDVPEHLASNAYRLLNEWRVVPGSTERMGEVNEEELRQWVKEARELLAAADRQEVGDIEIGKVFSHARGDEDETWPTRPVRDLIEALAIPEIERGFQSQIFNNRGGTSRGLLDGGQQERELASRYDERAALIRDGWPRTAAVLSSLARGYEREAARHDEDAERFRQGMER